MQHTQCNMTSCRAFTRASRMGALGFSRVQQVCSALIHEDRHACCMLKHFHDQHAKGSIRSYGRQSVCSGTPACLEPCSLLAGTGKTLSLLCSVLHWLQDANDATCAEESTGVLGPCSCPAKLHLAWTWHAKTLSMLAHFHLIDAHLLVCCIMSCAA